MIVAKQIITDDSRDANHPIIHFYGEGAFRFAKVFLKMIENEHPFQALVSNGFIPVGDSTWMKP